MGATISQGETTSSGRPSFLVAMMKTFMAWVTTGFATGLLSFGITLGAIVLFGNGLGKTLGIVIAIALTILLSDLALTQYERYKIMGTKPGFFAKWAESLILPFVGRKSKKHGDDPKYAKASFMFYTFWAWWSGAIVTQGFLYERFGRRPSRLRTIWGGLLFGGKLGFIYAAPALAVRSGGNFWHEWWGAWW